MGNIIIKIVGILFVLLVVGILVSCVKVVQQAQALFV